MNRVLLVVGNGLSKDLHDYLGLSIDPSFPFSFNVPFQSAGAGTLLDSFPKVAAMVGSQQPGEDYETIRKFLKDYRRGERDHVRTHSELCQYLAISYGYDTLLLWKHLWKHSQNTWRWSTWLTSNHNRLAAIVSFNYDAGLELALGHASLPFYRLGTPEEGRRAGIPIFKPHGSCDFDTPQIVSGASPFQVHAHLNAFTDEQGRGFVLTVPPNALLQLRNEPDLVLPGEASEQTTLPWVGQGYEVVREACASVDTCVVVGLSYQECDRPEIDRITRQLSPDTTIWLVDRAVGSERTKDFENALKNISREVKPLTPEDFLII